MILMEVVLAAGFERCITPLPPGRNLIYPVVRVGKKETCDNSFRINAISQQRHQREP